MSGGQVLGLAGLLWVSAAAFGFVLGWLVREENDDD